MLSSRLVFGTPYADAVNQSSTRLYRWRRLLGADRFAESLRVLLALGGVAGWYAATREIAPAITAMLGVIACALAETEDQWRSRLATLAITLLCFAVAAAGVQWLMPYPIVFALALAFSTFALVMLGAVSGRYATIAGGTLILAVYMMIGTESLGRSGAGFLHQPLQLLAGAAWYGALSLLWAALVPQHAVRQSLAQVFDALADLLDAKAALFVPVRGVDYAALQLALTRRNQRVVAALNEARLALIDRIGTRRPRGAMAHHLRQYFIAQDLHERVSSAHFAYQPLADALFHSDVLFRCDHVLRLLGGQCRRRADQMRVGLAPDTADADHDALADLRAAVATLHAPSLQPTLDALMRNIASIQHQLVGQPAGEPLADEPHDALQNNALQNPAPQTLREAWARVSIQLSPQSFRFRHALRLSLALLAGYIVLRALHPQNGYWILLTTLLVCQPTYHATRRRLLQRVAGTFAGLFVGWMALRLLPAGPWQMALVTAAGVGFFAARRRRYALATASITVFVVLCFNQVNRGYEVMGPRLLDTLIGAGIAALAIRLVLPNWRARALRPVLADTLRNHAHYLAQVIDQYASGRRDDLAYRIARRDAHNGDAALSGVVSSLVREPGAAAGRDWLLRFLSASHTLLGHISALAAHRQMLKPDSAHVLAVGIAEASALERLATTLQGAVAIDESALQPPRENTDAPTRLVHEQLARIASQRARLAALLAELPDHV